MRLDLTIAIIVSILFHVSFVFGDVIAGFFHMSMVMNVGYLHGGMNLYNNGFSGGFVAAVLVPIFDSLKKTS